MYIVGFGVDIFDNDVEANMKIVDNINKELKSLKKYNILSRVSNVTGDDIVITSLIPEELLEFHNKKIFEILYKYAEGFDDLNGVSKDKDKAKEGVSYTYVKSLSKYGDAIVLGFDTYGGESVVNDYALYVERIAKKLGYEASSSVCYEYKKIEGVGYSGKDTDDPIVIIAVKELEDIKKLSTIIYGALLAFDNLYFVRNSTPISILPPGVIYTMSAFLNGNIIDLYEGIKRRVRF
ncbi:hypothetical protein ACPB8Q_05175 [Methanocaldococcus indicus]|uniref:hypothetical protein n=1 Tax=Methanocaldococcus indicus TaxID=213231 RepID=UPI003C6D3C17